MSDRLVVGCSLRWRWRLDDVREGWRLQRRLWRAYLDRSYTWSRG